MKKPYSIAIIAIGVMIGLSSILFIVGREEKITTGIQFYLSPSDTTIRINNEIKKPNNKLQLALKPGEYEIEAVRLHFASKIQRFTVKEGSLTPAPVSLEPTNSIGEELLKSEMEQLAREQVMYQLSLLRSVEIENRTPLVSLLPAYNSDFRIDYGTSQKNPNDPTAVTIFITTDSVEQRQSALNWIQGKGYDPNTLEIIYRFYDDL